MSKRQDPKPTGVELRSVISEFLEEYRGTSPKTLDYYRGNLDNFLRYLSAEAPEVVLLEDVGPIHVRAWINYELGRSYEIKGHIKQIQPATVEGRRQALYRLFAWAVEQETFGLDRNPVAKVRRPRLPKRVIVGFDKQEVRALLLESRKFPGATKKEPSLAWLGKRNFAMVTLLLDTGARASELLGLTMDDIDWPRGRILLHGKGAKDRRVPFHNRASTALKEYLHVRPEVPFDNLWVTIRHTPLTTNHSSLSSLDALLKALGRYSGVEDVHAHRLRHTFAVRWWMSQDNPNIYALMNLLGHVKIETTMRYLRGLGIDYGTDGNFASVMDHEDFRLL